MDKHIGTGAGLAIVVVVVGAVAFLTLRFANEFRSFPSEVVTVPAVKDTESKVVAPSVEVPMESRLVETKDFFRSKYRLSFSYPTVFHRQKEIDDATVYTAHFTSKDIQNDGQQLGNDDVQLSVVVNKKGNILQEDNLKELEQLDIVKIEKAKTVVVDGISATQRLLQVLQKNPGCDFRTDFTKSGLAYRISLFTIGGSCETLKQFMPDYDALLQSFHVGK